jgi:hypothetical protein
MNAKELHKQLMEQVNLFYEDCFETCKEGHEEQNVYMKRLLNKGEKM